MINKIKIIIILLLTISCSSIKKNSNSAAISLKIKSDTLFRYSNKDDISRNNSISYSLKNTSDKTIFLVIDTLNFRLDEIEKVGEYAPNRVFMPFFNAFNRDNKKVESDIIFYTPDVTDVGVKIKNKEMLEELAKTRKEAENKYDFLNNLKLPERGQYYYYLRKKEIFLKPGKEILLNTELKLPENVVIGSTPYEKLYFENDTEHMGQILIYQSRDFVEKILTKEDLDSMSKRDVLIFDGFIKSNRVPIKQIDDGLN